MINSAHATALSRAFLITSVLLGLAAMLLGAAMGAAEDFRLRGVHVHVNLVGYVTMFLAGLFYRAFPEAACRLGWIHYGLLLAGVVLMAPGIAGIMLPIPEIAWLTKPGSVLVIAGMFLFLWIVARRTTVSVDPQGGHREPLVPVRVIDEARLDDRREAARLRAEKIIAEAARCAADRPLAA
ncbi:hypothetical protein [Terrarubrum flagellatum]|uniref:hypothetical protein n=1 Tax=Terrirubrum flagellatum TaxID=2895980 RepID=UPI0031454BF3